MGRGAPPILDPAKHDLIPVPPLIASLIVFDRRLPLLSTGDAGAYALVLQCFSEPVGVKPAIPKQRFDAWQAAEQGPCADIVAHLPRGDEQVDRSSLTVADGVKFGIHAAFRSSDQATAPPFFRGHAERPKSVHPDPNPRNRRMT